MKKYISWRTYVVCVVTVLFISNVLVRYSLAATPLIAKPPIHILSKDPIIQKGLSPKDIKAVYHIPDTSTAIATGTIAIVVAFHQPTIDHDLDIFSNKFGLPHCTVAEKCLEIHPMATGIKTSSNWGLEENLDTQWAHAMATNAHILVVEAKSDTLDDLMNAVDYARSRPDVKVVSMSWGSSEFKSELTLDSHFIKSGMTFVAASGDNGTGTIWPAVSPNVLAVGGTELLFDSSHAFIKETAWSGSGGGVSKYEPEPLYQKTYDIPRALGKRAVPDVAFNADPNSGYAVFSSAAGKGLWYVVGGTSAGAPQWAGLAFLDGHLTIASLYTDKASVNPGQYFRDIVSGKNGDCGYYCNTRRHYDYVTGLGSPITIHF